ncbi:hypothetical protein [uncultured Leptotrichia sp.]|jgi:hypothetical protein|uniref:hypothetical protein n=1 Tax=uncultured Leptotrichia sp. TaxID=159271 RepID=UPI00262CE798|nr:hypothetical protein [uncultured Leptotrichia sp.]
MKKLITIILFIFSMQIFAGQYQVIKQKNVTLSKEQIDLENKKIEETVSKYPKKVLKEMISYYFSVASKVNNEMSKEEKESMQLLPKEFSSFFSEIFNFNIKTVKYLSNTKVSVTYEVVILDLDKILDEKEMKKRFFEKYGYEIKDDEDFVSLSEVKKGKDIMNEMLREGMRNPKNYVTDKVTDELNKIGNEWKFKDAEKFEEILKKMK